MQRDETLYNIGETISTRNPIGNKQLYIISGYPISRAEDSPYVFKCRELEYHGKYINIDNSDDEETTVNAMWFPRGSEDKFFPNVGTVWEAVPREDTTYANWTLIARSSLKKEYFSKPNMEVSY